MNAQEIHKTVYVKPKIIDIGGIPIVYGGTNPCIDGGQPNNCPSTGSSPDADTCGNGTLAAEGECISGASPKAT